MDLQSLKNQLNDKYHLSEIDPTEVEFMFKNAMLSHLNKLAIQITPKAGDPSTNQTTFTCAESFATCTSGAYAFEAGGLVACNGTDIFPPVAVLCFASVMTATYYMLDDCESAYNLCEGANHTEEYLGQAVIMTFYKK
ncbi:MAG TPA: hypothetical protein VFL76_04120 [Edaphocola sp.]|nr:hypothetical protein [Edaphocola sp.]